MNPYYIWNPKSCWLIFFDLWTFKQRLIFISFSKLTDYDVANLANYKLESIPSASSQTSNYHY